MTPKRLAEIREIVNDRRFVNRTPAEQSVMSALLAEVEQHSATQPPTEIDAKKLREAKRETQKYRKALEDHVKAVMTYLEYHDHLMRENLKGEEHRELVKKVAKLANALEMANDQARFFALGVDYRTDTERKKKFREELLKGES
jgi:hypothetical protein